MILLNPACRSLLLAGLICLPGILSAAPVPLTESTFTEIIREAKVVGSDQRVVTAKTNMVFHATERVRTGSASRVEMTAPDKTITRIGANTVFSFAEGERNLKLEQGSLLFHSPAGVGGGAIQYRGAAAAVLGTTMVCGVMANGSFKVLDLEGKVTVTLKNGKTIQLNPGEMMVVSPDATDFPPAEVFNLQELVSHLELVIGFSHPLSSLPLILAASREQNREIADGTLKFVVSLNDVLFGLNALLPPFHSRIIYPPETPDRTYVPVSRTHK